MVESVWFGVEVQVYYGVEMTVELRVRLVVVVGGQGSVER